jgi:serine/threonine protein kinase
VSLEKIDGNKLNIIESELNLLKKLNHPNIVSFIGVVRSERHLNIILEYIENGSLQAIVKKFGKFPETLVAVYVMQILEGLAYLHSQKVIHR